MTLAWVLMPFLRNTKALLWTFPSSCRLMSGFADMKLLAVVVSSLLLGYANGSEGPVFRRSDVELLDEAYRRSLQQHKPVCFGYMTTVLVTLNPGQATSPAGGSTLAAGNGKRHAFWDLQQDITLTIS